MARTCDECNCDPLLVLSPRLMLQCPVEHDVIPSFTRERRS
jgi:hypothetical protein